MLIVKKAVKQLAVAAGRVSNPGSNCEFILISTLCGTGTGLAANQL